MRIKLANCQGDRIAVAAGHEQRMSQIRILAWLVHHARPLQQIPKPNADVAPRRLPFAGFKGHVDRRAREQFQQRLIEKEPLPHRPFDDGRLCGDGLARRE